MSPAGKTATTPMPSASFIRDPWLPRQLPPQLAALGDLYLGVLERGVAAEDRASVWWRLHAALSFASTLAPLSYLAGVTGLTVEQLTAILVEFGDDGAAVASAA